MGLNLESNPPGFLDPAASIRLRAAIKGSDIVFKPYTKRVVKSETGDEKYTNTASCALQHIQLLS